MGARGRVYYISPNLMEEFRRCHGEDFMPSPGGNKIAGVSRALTVAGVSSWTVSCPVVSSGVPRLYDPTILRGNGYNSVYLLGIRNRWFNRPVAFFTYGWFCLRKVRTGDRVIFYNTTPEYVLGAAILRARRIPGVLDIEDAARRSRMGPRDLLVLLSFLLLRKLCSRRYVVAAEAIGRQLKGNPEYHVCRGVCEPSASPERDFRRLTVLYGGAKTAEWGTGLFADAIRCLARQPAALRERIRFIVTGSGDFSAIRQVSDEVAGLVDVGIAPDSSTAEYEGFLRVANVGLELRMPGTEGAETTFPSKILELAGNGLLVVTTGTGDVPSVLDSDSAVFLREASGAAVVDALVQVLAHPTKWAEVAANGAKLVANDFSPPAVGQGLRDFLFGSVGE